MNIGINGFGRIGKSILLQSIHDTRFTVKSINAPHFNTTVNPTILDKHAPMELTNNEFKFTIWYDNEWSYSSQTLNLANYIHNI